MQTEKQLKKEIDNILSEIKEAGKIDSKESGKLERKLKKKLQYLKTCLLYLETRPTKTFLEKEKDRLLNRINLIQKQLEIPENVARSEATKIRSKFEKQWDVPKLKTHLSTINFLLK